MQAASDHWFSPHHETADFHHRYCAAILGAVPAASHAADLGQVPGPGAKHVRTSRTYRNWRKRCAYAGYYCLYAEYRYVYHYPFDDRPVAYTHFRPAVPLELQRERGQRIVRKRLSLHPPPNPDSDFFVFRRWRPEDIEHAHTSGPEHMVCGTVPGVRGIDLSQVTVIIQRALFFYCSPLDGFNFGQGA
jgi:hypothetical protein